MRLSEGDAPRSGSPPILTTMNITPLIDVMLVLLIVFMTAPGVAPPPKPAQDLDAALGWPRVGGSVRPPSPGPGLLVLDEDGMTLDGSALLGMDDLDTRLRARGLHVLLVKAAGSLSYGRVVGALDVARGAGVERIGIVSEARKEP